MHTMLHKGSRGDLQPRASKVLQICDQVGANPEASRGVRGYSQGSLLQVQTKPEENPEARGEEVVLRAHCRIRLGLRLIKQHLSSPPRFEQHTASFQQFFGTFALSCADLHTIILSDE